MGQKLIERLIKLLEVKSMITLMLVAVACWGFIAGLISTELFATWVGMIITYFFKKDSN